MKTKNLKKITDLKIEKIYEMIIKNDKVLQCEWIPHKKKGELLGYYIIIRFKKTPKERAGFELDDYYFPGTEKKIIETIKYLLEIFIENNKF